MQANDLIAIISEINQRYIVYDNGTIYSKVKNRLLMPGLKNGYPCVTLSISSKKVVETVHRIIAVYFIPNPLNKPCVNHIDGNKRNNRVENLEWCTYSENERHSIYVLGKNRSLSEATKQKIRIKSLGRDMSKVIAASLKKRTGKALNDEHKESISNTLKNIK